MTFGDAHNDYLMIKNAGLGVAMGNAIDELKAMATDVIGCNDEDAVAKFLASLSDI